MIPSGRSYTDPVTHYSVVNLARRFPGLLHTPQAP